VGFGLLLIDRPADQVFLVSLIAPEAAEDYGTFLKETLRRRVERIVSWAQCELFYQMCGFPQKVGYIRTHLRTQKTACTYKISPPHCIPADVPVMYGIRASLGSEQPQPRPADGGWDGV
jgi:hypothetical protein